MLCSSSSAERRDFKAAIFQTADWPEISNKRRFCRNILNFFNIFVTNILEIFYTNILKIFYKSVLKYFRLQTASNKRIFCRNILNIFHKKRSQNICHKYSQNILQKDSQIFQITDCPDISNNKRFCKICSPEPLKVL